MCWEMQPLYDRKWDGEPSEELENVREGLLCNNKENAIKEWFGEMGRHKQNNIFLFLSF